MKKKKCMFNCDSENLTEWTLFSADLFMFYPLGVHQEWVQYKIWAQTSASTHRVSTIGTDTF